MYWHKLDLKKIKEKENQNILVSEMLNHIKMLKLYGMESWQVNRIMAQRDKVE